MTLAELIFEKSKDLPIVKAHEVIDFIDFIKSRDRRNDAAQNDVANSKEEREAALAKIVRARIQWEGKPIPSRDELHDGARG